MLTEQTRFHISRLLRSIWLRPAMYAVGSVLALVLGPFLDPYVPDGLRRLLQENAVQDVLTILASSMLAVAIFSLGTMVSAFQVAADAATPRARPLLTEDRTAQNAISTFIGAFLFSVLGVMGLSIGVFSDGGRLTLFALAILLIAIVLVTLIGWMQRLANLGGVTEVITKLERASSKSFSRLARSPRHGGRAVFGPPPGAEPVHGENYGYVQYVDTAQIARLADETHADIYIAAMPGTWVHPDHPLAYSTIACDDETSASICSHFVIGNTRTFEADPRYGLVVLSEIAAHALSPGMNDPGTAIDVLLTATRILGKWRKEALAAAEADGEVEHPRLLVPAADAAGILDDAFGVPMRDGDGDIAVARRLQQCLTIVAEADQTFFGAAVRSFRAEALERNRRAMSSSSDLDELARTAAQSVRRADEAAKSRRPA